MDKNIITLSKWLVTKGVNSVLKIQKLLFFIRYEEIKNNKIEDSYFKKDENFQAWIYGPVNYESFTFLQPWFNNENELEYYFLTNEEVKEIDKKYDYFFQKYNKFSAHNLVSKSHKNMSWINARGNLGANEICKTFMKEDETFLEFKK